MRRHKSRSSASHGTTRCDADFVNEIECTGAADVISLLEEEAIEVGEVVAVGRGNGRGGDTGFFRTQMAGLGLSQRTNSSSLVSAGFRV